MLLHSAALSAGTLSKEENIRLAKLITSTGDISSFAYLVGMVQRTNNPPIYFTRSNLAHIDTQEALSLLKEALSILIDQELDNVRTSQNPRLAV